MSRRIKSDTVAAAAQMGNKFSAGLPRPTETLTPAALKHFERIVRSKNVLDLSENDLALMTALARMMALQSDATDLVEAEGMIISTEKGETVHPHLRAMDVIAKAVAKYVTLLGMSASQRGKGASASSQARDKASAATRTALENASEEDLI